MNSETYTLPSLNHHVNFKNINLNTLKLFIIGFLFLFCLLPENFLSQIVIVHKGAGEDGDSLFDDDGFKNGVIVWSAGKIHLDTIKLSGIEESFGNKIPTAYELYQNYPNPFNAGTNIRYSIPQTDEVSLEIYNILGQRVRTLIDNITQSAGNYTAYWNGMNDTGTNLSSGIYLIAIRTNEFNTVKKIILLK